MAGLVATIGEAARAENAAAALRTSAIGELLRRRIPDPDPDPDDDVKKKWACDSFTSIAAEVAAAMNISHGKACGQLRIAESLRDHLPRVAALHAAGTLSAQVVATITWRTRLIIDDDIWARIDTALAQRATTWGPMPDERLTAALDALIYAHDPAAVITTEQRMRSRDVTVGAREDEAGTVSIFGRLLSTDGALVEKRIAAIAATVCPNDPRTAGERRSEALAAMAEGHDRLVCRCPDPTCPTRQGQTPSSPAVIWVIADQPALTDATHTNTTDRETNTTTATAEVRPSPRGTAVLADTGTPLPTPLLADLLARGATVKPLLTPCDSAPEPRYRPSATLQAFVRSRDLTCRFPGCRVPAHRCDIDHVVPYPLGPTHPSNLGCFCRKHHLLKTFWADDWSVTLAPDGTMTWIAPTGHTHLTHPGSRALFPNWNTTTAALPQPPTPTPSAPTRTQKMPLRQQTRAAQRKTRIHAERKHNTTDPPFWSQNG